MAGNALIKRRNHDPVGYVNNYEGEGPDDEEELRTKLRRKVQDHMQPTMDRLSRSQTRRGARDEAGVDATPEAQMEMLMRETGYTGNDPAEGMAHVWQAMPTDSVGELIDMLSDKYGYPKPFKGGGEPGSAGMSRKMKLGGPNELMRRMRDGTLVPPYE